MPIIHYTLLILFFTLTPALVVWLCRRYAWLDRLGPIMVLYAIGLVAGNLRLAPEEITLLQELLPNITIPLAIPMMLFGCRFSRHEAALQIKLVVSGFLSVAVAVVVGYLLFGEKLTHGSAIGGIITGMYTGGTLNAAALQAIFRIPSEEYVLINSYDILISFLYFVFLFSVGIRFFRRLFGQKGHPTTSDERATNDAAVTPIRENPYRRLLTREGVDQALRAVGTTLLIAALSAGVALLLPAEWFMVVFILLLTTLGVISSLFKPIQRLTLSYDLGMYLIYIFSLAIASMADFSRLDLAGGIYQLAFMGVAVFCSLALHALFCRITGVDADSMMISSVAFINSPPFVPMAAAAMKSKRALVTGLGAGIVGYAAGNHLGVLLAELLARL